LAGIELLATLEADSTISNTDRQQIKAERTSYEQTGKLLDILATKGPRAFESFNNALCTTEQDHIVSRLMDVQETVPHQQPTLPNEPSGKQLISDSLDDDMKTPAKSPPHRYTYHKEQAQGVNWYIVITKVIMIIILFWLNVLMIRTSILVLCTLKYASHCGRIL